MSGNIVPARQVGVCADNESANIALTERLARRRISAVQNRYVGDVGDFGKYGLLKAFAGDDLRLGVVWYLNKGEEANRDGGFTAYLDDEESRLGRCDPALFKALRDLVRGGDRSVEAVRTRGVLPAGTVFYDAPLPHKNLTPAHSRELRANWCRGAVAATTEADVVFLDPDNGLAGKSARQGGRNGVKYVFCEELRPHLDRDQSLVIYHHQGRSASLEQQITERVQMLRRQFTGLGSAWALTYHRQQARAYLVLAAERHACALRERTMAFVAGPWGAGKQPHFKYVMASSVAATLFASR